MIHDLERALIAMLSIFNCSHASLGRLFVNMRIFISSAQGNKTLPSGSKQTSYVSLSLQEATQAQFAFVWNVCCAQKVLSTDFRQAPINVTSNRYMCIVCRSQKKWQLPSRNEGLESTLCLHFNAIEYTDLELRSELFAECFLHEWDLPSGRPFALIGFP